MRLRFFSKEERSYRRSIREAAETQRLLKGIGNVSIKRESTMTTFESEFEDEQAVKAMEATRATREQSSTEQVDG